MTIFDDIYDPGFDSLEYLFGELVTYHKKGENPKQIKAMIDRNVPAVGEEGIPMRLFVVSVKNSSAGILAHEVSKVGDYLMIEKRRGEEPRRVSIMNVEDSTSGVTVLSCR